MSVTIDWATEGKSILHIQFSKPWNWDEFYIASAKGREMTESVAHTVHILMDFSQSGGMLPPSALTHFKKAASNPHPRRGIVVLVSKRMMLVKSLVNVLQKIVTIKNPILFADTVEEAKEVIAHVTDDRPDTLPLK